MSLEWKDGIEHCFRNSTSNKDYIISFHAYRTGFIVVRRWTIPTDPNRALAETAEMFLDFDVACKSATRYAEDRIRNGYGYTQKREGIGIRLSDPNMRKVMAAFVAEENKIGPNVSITGKPVAEPDPRHVGSRGRTTGRDIIANLKNRTTGKRNY